MFLNFKYLMQKCLLKQGKKKKKKRTLKILMLKLAMPKGFCLKKKKILINFAPQAGSSAENCVLRYLSAYLKAALPPDPIELELTFSFAAKLHLDER